MTTPALRRRRLRRASARRCRRAEPRNIGPAALRGRVGEGGTSSKKRTPLVIEGELLAKSTGTASSFAVGERVFHQKFGNGNVAAVDGDKLTIAFDKAGEKRVVDSFVERV